MKKRIRFISILIFILSFLACGNKPKHTEPVIYDEKPAPELFEPDTTSALIHEEVSNVEENTSTPTRSSASSLSKSHNSSSYDNMQGFDPASEDDMDDNGMSRYMENNDEEGWD